MLQLLPLRRAPAALRYGATAALVGIAFALRLELEDVLAGSPLLLFIPVVFLSALLFDQASGLFATVLSAGLATWFFIMPTGSFAVSAAQLVPVALFAAICGAISVLTEALRVTLGRLAEAEAARGVLLREMAHRTKNDLATASAILSLQALGQEVPEARAALEAATVRIGVIAKAHDRRCGCQDSGRVGMAGYLAVLCEDTNKLVGEVRSIAVSARCDPVELRSPAAVSVGLIVNELVTNAVRHAFPDGRGGTVEVRLRCRGEELELVVRDDGIGCGTHPAEGLGTRLIGLLARNLGGSVAREAASPGCIVRVRLRPA